MNENFGISDIEKMVNEALYELQRFGAPAGGKGTTTAVKDHPNAVAPTARSASYVKDDNGNENLVVRLQWIHNQHINKLIQDWNNKYGSILSAKPNTTEKLGPKEPTPIDLTILPGQEDEFKKILPNIASDISALNGVANGYYKQNALASLPNSIIGRIDEAPSDEDLKKAEERQAMNVDKILSLLSDPNYTKKLGFVGGVTVNFSQSIANRQKIIKQGNSCGWRISPVNQLMVKSYLPTATFVTNEWTWNNVFNRDVVDKTLFALEIKTANNKIKDINAWNQAAAQLGYVDNTNSGRQPYDVFRAEKKAGQLSQAEIMAVMFLANILNPQSPDFTKQKVYDISNTQLRPGMPDVFNTEVNLADNIQGIPNALAVTNDKKAAVDAGVQYKPQQIVRRGDEEITDIINILSAICTQKCGTSPRGVGGSLGDDIAHYADFYAKNYVCPGRNIVVPAIKEAVGNAFAIGLAAVYGFQVQKYSANLNAALGNARKDQTFKENITKCYQDFIALVGEINSELLKLSHSRAKSRANGSGANNGTVKAVVEEGLGDGMPKPISFKEFAHYAGLELDEEVMEETADETTPEMVQEGFFRLFDKMENLNG